MKTYYAIQLKDLRFQIHHISPKKLRIFEEYDENPVNTNFYMILMKHREIKMISDRVKITSVEVIKQMRILDFKDFMRKFNLKDDTMNERDLQRIYY